MRNYKKSFRRATDEQREWYSWARASLILVLIHFLVLGFVYDWWIFSSYRESFLLIRENSGVYKLFSFLPKERGLLLPSKVWSIATLPIASFILLLLYKRLRDEEGYNAVLIMFFIGGIGASLYSKYLKIPILEELIIYLLLILLLTLFSIFIKERSQILLRVALFSYILGVATSIAVYPSYGGVKVGSLVFLVNLLVLLISFIFTKKFWRKFIYWLRAKDIRFPLD